MIDNGRMRELDEFLDRFCSATTYAEAYEEAKELIKECQKQKAGETLTVLALTVFWNRYTERVASATEAKYRKDTAEHFLHSVGELGENETLDDYKGKVPLPFIVRT